MQIETYVILAMMLSVVVLLRAHNKPARIRATARK